MAQPFRSDIRTRRLERLTENETISSYTSWKQNLEFQLMRSVDFAPFLVRNFQWRPSRVPYRGLTDDGEEVVAANRKLAMQKHAVLDHMIRLISSYCPAHIQSRVQLYSGTWGCPHVRSGELRSPAAACEGLRPKHMTPFTLS